MMTKEKMLETVLSGLMPIEWMEWFEVEKIEEKKKEWNILLREKEERLPEEIKGMEWSLNGYRNSICCKSGKSPEGVCLSTDIRNKLKN